MLKLRVTKQWVKVLLGTVWAVQMLVACTAPAATLPPVFTLAPSPVRTTPIASVVATRENVASGTPLPTRTAEATPSATPTFSPTATETLSPTPTPQKVRVVIISIDGLRADAVQQAPMPNVQALAQRGAYTFGAQTIFPPVTLPSHTSMLTGQPPEVHGVLWNDYEPARGPITATTIFEYAHNAGLRTVMVVGKEKFKHFEVPGTLDAFVFATGGDNDVLTQAVQQQFDLMLVHLPNTDFFGHSTGWMSETYLFQLTRTDERLGEFLNALPPDVAVILSADHGGLGVTHGQNIPEDMTIPWIVAGPGVKPNYAITGAVSTLDTAATALYLLGLPVPEGMVGKVVLEAFVD